MDKYETFKQATFELLQASGQTSVYASLQDIAEVIDKEQSDQKKEPGITKESILAITNPVERIRAIRDNPALFGAANTHNELENKFQD